jgi:hypothetical protein
MKAQKQWFENPWMLGMAVPSVLVSAWICESSPAVCLGIFIVALIVAFFVATNEGNKGRELDRGINALLLTYEILSILVPIVVIGGIFIIVFLVLDAVLGGAPGIGIVAIIVIIFGGGVTKN